MVWLLDGYNVIRRDPELSALDRGSLEEGRNALLRLVAHTAGGSADDFIVVFDGVRAPPRAQARQPAAALARGAAGPARARSAAAALSGAARRAPFASHCRRP